MNNLENLLTISEIQKQIEFIKKRINKTSINGDSINSIFITAAVLIILTIIDNKIQLLFTHRTNYVNDHKDQVSFPGGVKEKDDGTLLETAFRETYEEIGIQFFTNDLIGKMHSYCSPTGFQIFPFFVFRERLENIKINEKEVRNVFFIPLKWLSNRDHFYQINLETPDNIKREVIYYRKFGDEEVWCITARILVDFIYQIE